VLLSIANFEETLALVEDAPRKGESCVARDVQDGRTGQAAQAALLALAGRDHGLCEGSGGPDAVPPAKVLHARATERPEVRRAFQIGGVQALVEQRRGPRGPHPNRVGPEIEARILAYGLDHPTHGAQRVANKLRLEGLTVSPSGVRGVWLRHDLETRLKRLLRPEQAVAQDTTLVLAEEQVRLLERHSVDFRCRHVEASQRDLLLVESGSTTSNSSGSFPRWRTSSAG
jgi:hypothetical protein